MKRPRLLTIPLSHYCERARWALDLAGIDYEEERHLQIFHMRPVRRAGGRRTVPVLVTAEETLADSADIVAWADERMPEASRLRPSEIASEVEETERWLAGEFGVESRRLVYGWYLPHRRLLLRYNNEGAPRIESVLLHLGFPIASRMVSRHFDIRPETVDRARSLVESVFERIEEMHSDGRPFLCGDRFTGADLTFAALAGPLVMPPGYAALPRAPLLDELPEPLRSEVSAMREQPAGRRVMRLYAEHRRPAGASPASTAGRG